MELIEEGRQRVHFIVTRVVDAGESLDDREELLDPDWCLLVLVFACWEEILPSFRAVAAG